MSEYERLKQMYEEMKKAPAEALRKENEALKAELHRWQHGAQVEGDYVCSDAAENEQLRARVKELEADNEFWRNIVKGFWVWAGVDKEPEGEPWKCAETNGRIFEFKAERDALAAEYAEYAKQVTAVALSEQADHDALTARVAELEDNEAALADVQCALMTERDALAARLAIAVEALTKITKMPGGSANMARAAESALAKLGAMP